ncbi:MurR/RpiR family transcriptional regulator [Christensenella timonensis]|uniref:MurR/RpiR family transcriptional regulator n=1 Tax=Christensenella timonensis TaxID=1816678 RepID=UPI00083153CA|nr:MurR/RpiR family transcriptional regulator [Christensenella timonensis]
MTEDFYQFTSSRLDSLSNTERQIFNYVVKNMHKVKKMSIRELATACFVSTTTLFRFVKKLGFSGYAEFTAMIQLTEMSSREITIPNVMHKENYQEEYLKNVIEAVKVISNDKIEKFNRIMDRYPKVYILGCGLSEDVARYIRRILMVLGYDVETPVEDYEIASIVKRIKREDVLLVLSYSGNNKILARYIEQIVTVATPTIISITRADNNIIQNMSDLNFYIFADDVSYDDLDITSRCGMIAVIETLMYKRITEQK